MSTSYQAVIAVGLPYKSLDINGIFALEDACIEQIPIYYDSPVEDSVCGIIVSRTNSYDYKEIELDALQLAIDEAKKEFYNLTGQQGKVYLSTEGF